MKTKILLSIIACTVIYSVAGLYNPIIIADENSPDADYAKILMNKLYSYKNITVVNDNTVNVSETIFYNIPAIDEFNIKNRDEVLYIKFEKDGDNNIKFKKVEYIKKIDLSKDKIELFGKTYDIVKHTKDEIDISNEVKNITTNQSFEYKNYKIDMIAMSSNGNELLVNILKDGEILNKEIKIYKGETIHIKNSDISFCYENLTKNGRKNIFSFKIYNLIPLVDNEDFELNNSYVVNIDDNEIILKYKYPENLKDNFNIYNYNVKLMNIYNKICTFKITYHNNYQIKKEDIDGTECVGNNIFIVKKDDDKLCLYKDGKEVDKVIEYIGSKIILKDEILKSDGDIILIGGPVSNNITKKINDKLTIPITNENPGKNTGLIQKIKNPYNPNHYIYVLAGSNRYGTKACVLALSNGLYNDEDLLKVKLEDNKPVIIKN